MVRKQVIAGKELAPRRDAQRFVEMDASLVGDGASRALAIIKALRGARRRILRGWAKHSIACCAKRWSVDARHPSARAWCIEGAVNAVADGLLRFDVLSELEMSLRGKWFDRGLASFNDADRTLRHNVLALFDRTIKRVRAYAAAGFAVGAPQFGDVTFA